jgi:hypothetical protein
MNGSVPLGGSMGCRFDIATESSLPYIAETNATRFADLRL